MPKKPPKIDARSALVNDIMRDCEKLFPAVESGRKDGFEMVDHPEALRALWKVANRFPPIAVGDAHAGKRRVFYAEFRQALKVQGGFRKGGAANNQAWERIQANLKKLEATG